MNQLWALRRKLLFDTANIVISLVLVGIAFMVGFGYLPPMDMKVLTVLALLALAKP